MENHVTYHRHNSDIGDHNHSIFETPLILDSEYLDIHDPNDNDYARVNHEMEDNDDFLRINLSSTPKHDLFENVASSQDWLAYRKNSNYYFGPTNSNVWPSIMDESHDWLLEFNELQDLPSVEQESNHDFSNANMMETFKMLQNQKRLDNASNNPFSKNEIENHSHPMTEMEKQQLIDIARNKKFSVLRLIQQFTQKFPNRSIIEVYQFVKSMVNDGVLVVPHSPSKNRKNPPLTQKLASSKIVRQEKHALTSFSTNLKGSKRINGPMTRHISM